MTEQSYLSDQFIDRVKRSYRLSAAPDAAEHGSIWMSISAMQRPIHDALMDSGNDALRGIFADPGSTDMYYGVDNMAKSLRLSPDGTDITDRDADSHAVLIRQLFVSLGSALALLRWLPPDREQSFDFGEHGDLSSDIEGLLVGVSDILGFDIQFPNPFSPEMGLATSRGLASYRAVQALYQAHRIQQELAGSSSRSVIEIGPGMGRTAYYATRGGISDYTTIDLPLGVVGQACFLGATLGPEAVWMVGDQQQEAADKIRLLPSTLALPDRNFGLVVNVDSMPEMGAAALEAYAIWIASHAEGFLSINHEAHQSTVADLGRRFFASAMSRRAPYWMRTAYVEETYRFRPRRLVAEIERLQAYITALQASTSWRITRPLRAIKLRWMMPKMR